jgi:hypothetical protein
MLEDLKKELADIKDKFCFVPMTERGKGRCVIICDAMYGGRECAVSRAAGLCHGGFLRKKQEVAR